MSYLLLLLGLILLVVGGEFLVKGSVALALKFNISTLVIGLTVVAFATSAPELIVSLQAAFEGHPDIALGNVVGSNIANIGLIMGLSAFIYVLPVHKPAYRFDWLVMVGVTILLYLVLLIDHKVGFVAGALFVVLLIAYNYHKINQSRKDKTVVLPDEVNESVTQKPIWKILSVLLIGILGLRFGANFFVDGAAGIAQSFGVSERLISVTVVAFGTSVPELVASLIAARKNEKDLAIGNLIGSNLFNVLAVLGFTALFKPIRIQDLTLLQFDYWWMLGFAVLLFPFMGLTGKNKLDRFEGFLLFSGYIIYIVLNIIKR